MRQLYQGPDNNQDGNMGVRRKFIYSRELGKMVEVSIDYEQEPRDHSEVLWNDRHYNDLKATDGTPIDSRAKHRAYMKANGLTTMDDFKDEWASAEKARADYYSGKRGSISRDDIARAIHQLQEKRR